MKLTRLYVYLPTVNGIQSHYVKVLETGLTRYYGIKGQIKLDLDANVMALARSQMKVRRKETQFDLWLANQQPAYSAAQPRVGQARIP